MAKKLCVEINCYKTAVDLGRCQNHQREPFQGTFRSERLPSDWASRRKIILNRYDRICHLCGGEGADGVDHVIAGDDHSLENLRPVHHHAEPRCHWKKTAYEGIRAREGKGEMPF